MPEDKRRFSEITDVLDWEKSMALLDDWSIRRYEEGIELSLFGRILELAEKVTAHVKLPTEPATPAPIAAQTEKCAALLCGGWESHPIHHNRAFSNYHAFQPFGGKDITPRPAEQVDAARCPKCGSESIDITGGMGRTGEYSREIGCAGCGEKFTYSLLSDFAQFFRAASLKQENQPPVCPKCKKNLGVSFYAECSEDGHSCDYYFISVDTAEIGQFLALPQKEVE